MPALLIFSTSGILGYILFNILTDPKSRVKNKIPYLKIKWVQILPNVRIHAKGKIIFLHHWMGLSVVLLMSIFISHGFLDLMLTKGMLTGGIIHGLSYSDWKKIITTS